MACRTGLCGFCSVCGKAGSFLPDWRGHPPETLTKRGNLRQNRSLAQPELMAGCRKNSPKYSHSRQ